MAEVARKKRHPNDCEVLWAKTAQELAASGKRADPLVNVLAHVPDINDSGMKISSVPKVSHDGVPPFNATI